MSGRDERRIAIFDFDGTLFDTDLTLMKAAQKALGRKLSKKEIRALPHEIKSKIYDLANNDIAASTPNKSVINRMNTLGDRGYALVILTARHKSSEPATLELVRMWSIGCDAVYHNSAGVYIPDEEFKAIMLEPITFGYKSVEIYEDKRENIDFLRERFGSRGFRYYLVKKNGFRRV